MLCKSIPNGRGSRVISSTLIVLISEFTVIFWSNRIRNIFDEIHRSISEWHPHTHTQYRNYCETMLCIEILSRWNNVAISGWSKNANARASRKNTLKYRNISTVTLHITYSYFRWFIRKFLHHFRRMVENNNPIKFNRLSHNGIMLKWPWRTGIARDIKWKSVAMRTNIRFFFSFCCCWFLIQENRCVDVQPRWKHPNMRNAGVEWKNKWKIWRTVVWADPLAWMRHHRRAGNTIFHRHSIWLCIWISPQSHCLWHFQQYQWRTRSIPKQSIIEVSSHEILTDNLIQPLFNKINNHLNIFDFIAEFVRQSFSMSLIGR